MCLGRNTILLTNKRKPKYAYEINNDDNLIDANYVKIPIENSSILWSIEYIITNKKTGTTYSAHENHYLVLIDEKDSLQYIATGEAINGKWKGIRLLSESLYDTYDVEITATNNIIDFYDFTHKSCMVLLGDGTITGI